MHKNVLENRDQRTTASERDESSSPAFPSAGSNGLEPGSDSPLALLRLGIRHAGFKALAQLGITTLDALLTLSANDLLQSGLFNQAQVADVIACLALGGKTLRNDAPVNAIFHQPTPPLAPTPAVYKTEELGAQDLSHRLAALRAAADLKDLAEGQEAAFQEIADSFAAGDPFREFSKNEPKRARRGGRPRLTDNERARKKAEAKHIGPSCAPRLDNPEDVKRIERLRRTITLDAVDTAWLYGVSREVVYAMCQKGAIKHQRGGDRYLINTRAVFEDLFPTTGGRPPVFETTSARRKTENF